MTMLAHASWRLGYQHGASSETALARIILTDPSIHVLCGLERRERKSQEVNIASDRRETRPIVLKPQSQNRNATFVPIVSTSPE